MKFVTVSVLLFSIFIFCFHGNAQENEKRFSIGVLFSPDYSYCRLKTDASHKWMADIREELFSPKFGYTSGIFLKYRMNEKLTFDSGVRFSDKGKKMVVKKEELVDVYGNQTSDPAVPDKATTGYHYQYVGVPVKLNYYFWRKNIKLFLSAGFSTDFFLSGRTKSVMKFEDRTEKETSEIDADFNKINVSGLAGLGMETSLSNRLQLRAEPVFRYSFIPVADGLLKEHLYSIGMNVVLFSNF